MMPIQRLSPSPVPSPTGFVVKNGSNTWRRCSGGMPGPLSSTTMLTPSSLAAVHTVSTPSRAVALSAGDAGQQRAERFQLVGLDELVLRLLQLAQSRLQLRIEASLLDRHRRLVRDAGENPALLVAQAARSAVIDGQHADGLIANAQRYRHAGLDAVGGEVRGDGEAALRPQVVDLHERLLQKRVAREGIGRGQDRQGADRARLT